MSVIDLLGHCLQYLDQSNVNSAFVSGMKVCYIFFASHLQVWLTRHKGRAGHVRKSIDDGDDLLDRRICVVSTRVLKFLGSTPPLIRS
jgi:hypothetical protein